MEKAQLATVSEWMARGSVVEYIIQNSVNRLELVSGLPLLNDPSADAKQQLHGAAQGLEYLHDNGIVHGNLMGVRIPSFQARCCV